MSNSQSPVSDTNAPSVAVVIPTHNNLSLLLECLESVRGLDYPREQIQVIVVDNASTDQTLAVLATRHPHVMVIGLDHNTGFAPACNRGADEAESEYVAFLNNDAVADPGWIRAMLSALEAGGEGTVCAASTILSRDGDEVEFDGAASNLFGAGRPTSVWGWPDLPAQPSTGTPLLFASGGAMLIRRDIFLEVGGFDPAYFAYFEDVDLGWRLWTLGYRVVYAADAKVRHIGGATGKRSGIHRRYTLWESNSLATIIKNYESGNMERILSAALLLEYRRTLLSAGDAFNRVDYLLTSPPDNNETNTERLPKVSVAHLAGVARLGSMLPNLMSERRRIQAARKRSDGDILPLLGRAFAPQFAGTEYARAASALYDALDLHKLAGSVIPTRVLLVGAPGDRQELEALAHTMGEGRLVAIALVGSGRQVESTSVVDGHTVHTLGQDSNALTSLVSNADEIIATRALANHQALREAGASVSEVGAVA